MSLGNSHLKVFVSSCMEELRPERVAVKQLLDKHKIPNFVFEEDVAASGRSPREIYSEALEDVKVYIGIFWEEFGKHTIKEYRHARKLGLSCHIYVKKEESQRDALLVKFLKEEFKGVDAITYVEFLDAQELCSKITGSVIQWYEDQLTKQSVEREGPSEDRLMPTYLPCLCDRDDQDADLKKTLYSYLDQRSTRPLMLVLPGPHREEHGLYMNRVELDTLKKYVSYVRQRKRLKTIEIRKKANTITTSTQVGDEIGELLTDNRMSVDEIVQCLRAEPIGVLLVIYKIRASECAGQYRRPLHHFAKYLAEFPNLPEDVLLCTIICLQEDVEEDSQSGSWLSKLWRGRTTQVIPGGVFHEAMTELEQQYHQEGTLRFARLPRLDSPVPGDVERWLGHDLVKPWKCRVIPLTEIDELFEGKESMPMSDLSIKLADLLDKQAS